MNKTSIEWTNYTWNPVTGCNKVSQGCKNCYAETIAKRFWGERKFTDVIMHQDRLHEPAKNKKKWAGKKVFVCSMSDLFHESVSFEFIRYVFNTFYYLPDTTFQIVTKRPERALDFFKWARTILFSGDPFYRPASNVWIGTSCEDQATANQRIPLLLQIPAAVRFMSCEPLLGPIDLTAIEMPFNDEYGYPMRKDVLQQKIGGCNHQPGIDWVIAGGESGHNARPMHPDWVRSLRDQCNAAKVPFFFKQWGEYVPLETADGEMFYCSASNEDDSLLDGMSYTKTLNGVGGISWVKVGKSKAGNYLDQVQHLNFPL